MDQAELGRLADRFLSAWSSQHVERVVACYTDMEAYLREPEKIAGVSAIAGAVVEGWEPWE